MPPLPVPFRTELLRRILRRLDHQFARRIAAVAASEPGLLARIRRQARQRALQSLGLADIQAELEAIAQQKQALDQRRRQAHRAMLAVIRRIPVAEAAAVDSLRPHPQVVRALARAQAAHEQDLLLEHPAGREIVRLRREREQLLEALWLAGAAPPLQRLWRKLCELLGQEPTELQREILAGGDPTPA